MSKGFASTYRIVLLSGALLLCFGGVGVRLVWLHVINRDELLGSIAKTRRQLIVEKSRRGDIYDATGALLATSRSVLQLGVDPHSLRKEDEKHWPELVRLLRPYFAKEHLTEEKLRLILTTKYRAATPATGSVPATVAGLPSAGQTGFVFNLKLPPPAPVAIVATGPAAVGTDLDAEATEVRPGADTIAVDAVDETELAPEAEVGGRRKIQWAKLVDDLPEATYDEIKKLGIKGVYATSSYRRSYPHNQLGAHVVGFVHQGQPVIEGVKRIDHPIAGVERFADFYLRGQDGWREGEKDGRAKELPQFRTRTVELVDGYDVTLSLDTRVQNIVERELAIIAEKFDPLKATIIVSDPRTGFILGMGNYPSFNPNEYNKLRDDQLGRLKNIATSDVYDPGSVFKIVAASAALDQGIVTPDTRFDCSITKIDYRGFTRSLPDEAHAFDHKLSVAEIISLSSNRGAAQLAMQLGDERYYNYARAFGFGKRTGILGSNDEDLSRRGLVESRGNLKPPSAWDKMTITRMPMGHSISVTVLQMHQAMSVIASGGLLFEPQVIRHVRDHAGKIVYNFEPVQTRRAISSHTARTMGQLLVGCAMKGGTAPEAAIPGYEVAGKTGTTQKYLPEGRLLANGQRQLVPSKKHHVSSFVGFFPASQPQVVISVIVDDADGRHPGGAGGKVAAPSFRHIGEQLIPLLRIQVSGTSPAKPLNVLALQGTHP